MEINDQTRAEVHALHEAGVPRGQIATELAISPRLVGEVLGIDEDAIITAYNATPYRPVREIATSFAIDVPKLYDILRKRDMPLRVRADDAGGRRRVSPELLEMAVQMYLGDVTIGVITRDTSVTAPTLYAELDRREIPRRRSRG